MIMESFYFRVWEYVQKNNKLPKPESFNTSKQGLNYYVKALKAYNLISRVGYGVWKASKDYDQAVEKKKVKKVKKLSAVGSSRGKNIRGHGFRFKVKIGKIRNWNRREEWLVRKGLNFKSVGSNWVGQSFLFRGYRVWLTPVSVVVWFPKDQSYVASSASGAYKYAVSDIEAVVKGLESLLGVRLRVRGKVVFKVFGEHYGHLKNELARQYSREGKKLFVRDLGGCWLVIDASVPGQFGELEAVRAGSAVADMDEVVVPFFNDLKKHFEVSGEAVTVSGLLSVLQGVLGNQAVFDANMKSHIAVVKELGSGVRELNKKIKELRR